MASAELQPSVGDGDAELGLGQRALDVGRHVVRPFVIVAVWRDILWHDATQKSIEVAPDIGRCILLDQQRRGGVRDARRDDSRPIAGRAVLAELEFAFACRELSSSKNASPRKMLDAGRIETAAQNRLWRGQPQGAAAADTPPLLAGGPR